MEKEDSNGRGEREKNVKRYADKREDKQLKGQERNEGETKGRKNERGEGGRVWVWPGEFIGGNLQEAKRETMKKRKSVKNIVCLLVPPSCWTAK